MSSRSTRICLWVTGLGAATALSLSAILAEDAPPGPAATQPTKEVFKGDPYLLTTDPVTGDKLPAKVIIYQHEGRELRFADQKSLDAFKAKPAKYLPKVDELMVKQQMAFYPLDTCPVSGEKLGGMGKPADFIYKNRLVRFCCGGCIESLEKDPSKYIAKLNQAVIAKQQPSYPLSTCVISGSKLGEMGKPVDMVIGNRLVRLCCPACEKGVNKDPLKFLKMIDEAAKKKAAESKPAAAGDAGTHKHADHSGHRY